MKTRAGDSWLWWALVLLVLLEAVALGQQHQARECSELGCAYGAVTRYGWHGCELQTVDAWVPASTFDWRTGPPLP